ncbi:hypothetical protein [Methylophaga frappieri]|uniref:hypothetical protein n=1 Tax=Methylophaga frappieri (strain ATCC BAA-2434 / DSM 25690 / JAM7) TaxID=754477 RepID=UPI001EE66F56|nr:hypothetical protein [Methylophaga frappieri]
MAMFKRTHPDDIEYMSEVSSATLESSPRTGHVLLILSVLFFLCAGWWANVTEIDEVTRGEGKVVPSSRLQVIQNLEGGIIADVLVAEGQLVEKRRSVDENRRYPFFFFVSRNQTEILGVNGPRCSPGSRKCRRIAGAS